MFKVFAILIGIFLSSTVAYAQMDDYIVQPGDSMWKIAQKYEIGVSEIIASNSQVKNPNLIYPNERLTIPNIDTIKTIESQVIKLTNDERKKLGIPPLKNDWQLSRVARYKSDDMSKNNYFSHDSPTYGSPFDMMKHFGISYQSAGENIAQGQRTPDEVVRSWMNSPGHRANMLNQNYQYIGVGFNKTDYMWTQEFISK